VVEKKGRVKVGVEGYRARAGVEGRAKVGVEGRVRVRLRVGVDVRARIEGRG